MWLFGDGMGHYTATTNISKKWTTYYEATSFGNGYITIGAYGRFSRSGIRIGSASRTFTGNSYLSKVLTPASPTTVYVGVAIKLVGALTDTGATALFQILDATVEQCGMRINTDGTLSVMRGSAYNGTVLGTSAQALSLNTDYWIELGVTIDNAAGVYEIKVNNASWLSGTGADTQATGAASWNQIRLGGPSHATNPASASIFIYVADFKINDGSGAQCNTFMGDLRGDVHRPTADGAHTDWTPSSGADHFAMVDDAGSDDGDTTKNTEATVNGIDSYVMENLINAGAAIHAIQVILAAKKSDAGTCELKDLLRIAAADYLGGTTLYPSADSYADLIQIHELSPATAAAFTESEFNGMEVGAKKTA